MEKETLDDQLSEALAPLTAKYNVLIQSWADGWLLHLYTKREGVSNENHVTTVGAFTLLQAIEKGINYQTPAHGKQ